MPKLLALDFDGVISDSAPEAFVVALRTYVATKDGARFGDRGDLLSGGAPSVDRVVDDPLYRRFVGSMPLGNRAEDYAVILAALETDAELPDQAAYDAFREGRDAGWLRAFHERFYRERAVLAREDPGGWRGLMSPYPELVEVLRRRAGEVVLAIATAKDRRSVRALLRGYGIDPLFSEDRVLDKETGVSKSAHLEHLHRTCGVGYAEMTFVDDKVNHLDAVAPLGVRCALATWGYNGPREVALARERGYLVCRLDEAEEQLFG